MNMRRDGAVDTGDVGVDPRVNPATAGTEIGAETGAGTVSQPGAIAKLYRELREAALEPPKSETVFDFWGRAAFWLALAYYGNYYISLAVSRSQTRVSTVDYILSMANLVFHEAGHIILIPLGSFLSTLGGSLFQVLIPLVFLVAFLHKRNAFAAAVMLWWTGQNLIDLAPYIADARAQRLVLLGGVTGRDVPGYHDWNNLLTRLDMLELDGMLGSAAHRLGSLLILAALAWAAYLLWLLNSTSRRASDLSDGAP